MLKELFNIYNGAKAFAGGTAFLAADNVVDPVVNILAWLISLTGISFPKDVEEAIGVVLGFFVAYLVTWLVPNRSQKKESG